jgi:hypothetical protein
VSTPKPTPSAAAPSLPDTDVARSTTRRWPAFAGVAAVLIAALIGGGLYYRWKQNQRLTEKDAIVIADFENRTGDTVFDCTLKTALTVALTQSSFLNVLSDNQVAQTLKLMMRPAGTMLTPEIARVLCLRANSKAYIAGDRQSGQRVRDRVEGG